MGDFFNTAVAINYILHLMLGPCIYFMPAAFNMSGYFFGFVLLSLVSILTAGSIYYELRNKKTVKDDKLPLTDSVIIKKKEINNNFTVDLITTCCSLVSAFALQKYFIYLVNIFVHDLWPNLSHTMVNYAVLLASFICFFAVGLVQNFDVLRGFILVSGYFMISLVLVLAGLNLYVPKSVAELPTNLHFKIDYIFSFTWFVVSFFVQTKIPLIFPLLKDQSKNRTIVISILSVLGGFLIHGLIGYLGYRLLGNSIGRGDLMHVFLDSNSTLNMYLRNSYSEQNWVFQFLRILTEFQGICAILTILLGLPFTIAPITRFCKESMFFIDTNSVVTQTLIITPLIFGLTLLNTIPNVPLNTVFGLLGPSLINFITFLIPAFLYLLNAQKKSLIKNVLAMIIVILSIVYFIYGSLDALAYIIYLLEEIQGFQVHKDVRTPIMLN